MKLHHLMHKHGGRITAIHSIGHSTDNGVAYWYFKGDVVWPKGKPSTSIEIAPWAICIDANHPGAKIEVDELMAKMNDYLAKQGKWHEAKHKNDGRIVHWTPKARQAVLAL